MTKSTNPQLWEKHYHRPRSAQIYPDEALVRILSQVHDNLQNLSHSPGTFPGALDFGCGSGRHISLMKDLGFSPIFGCDVSEEALKISATHHPGASLSLIEPDSFESDGYQLPIPDQSLSVVVMWGVLHYNGEAARNRIFQEAKRVLRPQGSVIGTLRSTNDTHFQKNADMSGVAIRLFTLDEVQALLAAHLKEYRIGYLERAAPGDLEHRVAHWTFVGEV